MCYYMYAHHVPCAHLLHWFARCFHARQLELEDCNLPVFPVWVYDELFLCPHCMADLKEDDEEKTWAWITAA